MRGGDFYSDSCGNARFQKHFANKVRRETLLLMNVSQSLPNASDAKYAAVLDTVRDDFPDFLRLRVLHRTLSPGVIGKRPFSRIYPIGDRGCDAGTIPY